MKMLSVAELQERLGWSAVDEELAAEYGLVYLFVRPTHRELEAIYFCLDEDRSFIQQFGFGEWHCHSEDISPAVEMARQLILGEKCIVEQRDAAGRYRGSGPCEPRGIPGTLVDGIVTLRRVFFDRNPITEPIDFSRYFRGKHIWISLERKAEVERAYRKAGLAIPEW